MHAKSIGESICQKWQTCIADILVFYGSWFDHTKGYLSAEAAPHVLLVKYEEIVKVRIMLLDRNWINFAQRKMV